MMFRRRKRIVHHEIDPGEVLIDTKNIPGFNTQQFEGVIEQPIPKMALIVVWIFFVLLILVFCGKLIGLQIVDGASYLARSENNRLIHTPIFAERGIIYDRNRKELAWNELARENEPFLRRAYLGPGFGHVLGSVSYPARDQNGYYWRTDMVGKTGMEKAMNEVLHGTNGTNLVEVDAIGNLTSEYLIDPPILGENAVLTLDAGIQSALYGAIQELADRAGFVGGAGVIMDVHNGEVLALTNYPEIDPDVLSAGDQRDIIVGYNTNPGTPYLNRVVSGLFAPGSTLKPYIALGALQEGIITDTTTVYSVGKVEIPNPFFPDQPALFRDWRPEGHGVTDVYHAIADSVNTFFYAIGGGLGSQKGLGISNIDKYVQMFGLGEPAAVEFDDGTQSTIPNPEWKKKTFKDGTWRLGDTYNSAIGQFGFQITPLQLVRAVGAVANRGILVPPHLVKDTALSNLPLVEKKVSGIDARYYDIMHSAMRQTVSDGTAQILNVPYVHVAAKTGTAQTGAGNRFMNSWVTGFFPVESPRYAFVVVMERAKSTNQSGASGTMRVVLDYIQNNAPDYFEVVE